METFGEWLQQERNHRRLTREEFANRVGCSVAMLRKIEYGERRPSAQIAGLIANSLGIPPTEHETFIKVARGELRTNRISQLSILAQTPNISPAQTASHNNLPVLPTPLIGRGRELEQINQLLRDPQCRLLTLVGPGGIGKTRLAIEAASQIKNEFPDGVYFVPFASALSPRFMVPMIADATGFTFQGESSIEPKSQLFNYLKEKQILLLVDNLEHLLHDSAVTDLFIDLLERAAKVKLFATSRELLNLQSEWVFDVHGLPIPEDAEMAGTSVELFLQRARRVNVGFNLTTSVFPVIIRICQLVDGMPLGIELAAGWVRTLSCEEIAHEIEQGLAFLHTSMRDLPARHRSMVAVFDHSWRLLDEAEQSILCRLSVFQGGFKREAAQFVANATLSTLATLVTKSLIRRSSAGRYDLHELIRQYAQERLADKPEILKEAQACHASFYMNFLCSEDERLRGPEQQKSINELTIEMDNILLAWDWVIRQRKYELVSRSGRCIGRFFEVAGLFQEGIEQLEVLVQALQAEKRNADLNRLLGLAFLQQGLLYFRKGLFVRAEGLYKEGIALLRPIGDQALLADGLTFLGIITYLDGEYEQARDILNEGLECARSSNDRWFEAYAIYSLGYIDNLMGDYQKGYEQMVVALNMWRAIGDPHYIALGLNFLTPTIIKLGRYEEAKTFVWESIGLCEQAKNRWGLGTAYRYLGSVSLAEGQYAEAQAHFNKSLDVFGEYTEGWDVALTLYYSGEAARAEGNLTEARKNFLKALRISFDANLTPIAIDSSLGLAHLYLRDGEPERVLELSYHILNHSSSSQETKDRANDLRSELIAQLTQTEIEAIQDRAGEKTFDVVVKDLIG
ncbi:MAG: helix-turn-helix domain-containing protein [Anaerolineales bacterium]